MALTANDKTIPRLSKAAFWDIDLSTLDLERYASFTIVRVFERGTEEDIAEVIRYFGGPRIISVLSHAHALQPRAIAVVKKIFGVSL